MLTSSLTLLAGISTLYLFGNIMVESLKKNSVLIYKSINSFEITQSNIYMLSLDLFILILLLLAPVIASIIMTALASRTVQDNGQLDFNWERISFKLDKLNPINGVKKFFNKDSLVEILKSFLKLLVIGYVTYRVMRDETENIAFLAGANIEAIISYIGHIAFKIVTHACGIMIVLGLLDLMYVKWRYIDNLKMTKEEVKRETKDQDVPQEVKSKMKRLQFQAARRRMTTIIPTADVVITNPTHYAIALKYDREKMIAPVVIAKGVDIMAQAIKKIAEEHKITLVENRFLARELYEKVEENHPIPEALYAAVAEILAYVYKLKGKM